MLTLICSHIKNFFPAETRRGEFVISNGEISPSDMLNDGDCYLISGSYKNDGVHRHPAQKLTDESFNGEITLMSPPREFLDVCDEIKEYCDNKGTKPSPYLSESFGGYSYTKFKDSDGGALPWQKVFKSKLNAWRKI